MALKQIILVIVALLTSVLVWAGGSVAGNGGDVVFCPKGVYPIRLLDLYELEIFEKKYPKFLTSASGNAQVKAEAVISQLKEISPVRANRYLQELSHFMERIDFVNSELPNLPDDLNIVLPVGCELKQIAIQNKTNGQPRYSINLSLWQLLDENQKAALILHEIIYSENIDGGHTDSRATRAFNRHLVYGIKDMYYEPLVNFLKRVGIYTYLEDVTLSGDIIFGSSPCGFKKASGPIFNYFDLCKPDVQGLKLTRDAYGRVNKAIHPNGQVIYEMPMTEIGLPATARSYELYKDGRAWLQSFVDSVPFVFDDAEAKVTCLPGYPIVVDHNFEDAFSDEKMRFDLKKSKLLKCKIDSNAGSNNQLFFKGLWRQVTDFNLQPSEYARPSFIHFAKLEGFDHRGNWFYAKKWVQGDFALDTYQEIPKFLYKDRNFACEIENNISIYLADSPKAQTRLSFHSPCKVKIDQFHVNVSNLSIENQSGQISEFTNVEPIQFPILKKMRPLPARTWFRRDNDGAFFVIPYQSYVGEPTKIHTVYGAAIWIKGDYKLNESGTLHNGTLAKDAILRVNDGEHGEACKIKNISFKAGKNIWINGSCDTYFEYPEQ